MDRLAVLLTISCAAVIGCDSSGDAAAKPDAPAAKTDAPAAKPAAKADEAKPETAPPAEPVAAPPAEPVEDAAALATRTCKHVVELAGTAKAVEDEAAKVRVLSECEASLGGVAKLHASMTACMLAASSLDAVAACEESATNYASVLRSAVDSSNLAVCEHVLEIMKKEMGDMATEMSAGDIDGFRTKCAEDLEKERAKLGDAKFDAQAACVLKATDLEGMVTCDKSDD